LNQGRPHTGTEQRGAPSGPGIPIATPKESAAPRYEKPPF